MTQASAFVDPHADGEIAASALRTTQAVRERCHQLLALARRGGSGWFEVDESALDAAAARVTEVTQQRFRHRGVPLHSRWRHFAAGGVDRRRLLEAMLAGQGAVRRTHALIDLTVASVLLDADAGAGWRYTEAASGQAFTRSEGLAVASFHAFVAGLFSSDPQHPLQADARGLRSLVTEHLAQAFQSTPSNPLPGVESRAILLRRLGEVMSEQPEVFGEDGRPAGLFDMIVSPLGPDAPPPTADVAAHDILSQLLVALGDIWSAGNHIGGVALGDCWRHPAVRGEGATDGWVPIHQRPQWLTYSLLEPFEWGGVQVRGIEQLTGLPDYRSGGLMIDSGVLRLRNPLAAAHAWTPGDEVIVEWRALTVALLDELAPRVRRMLHAGEDRLPLGCILEGGTWAAGREFAQRLRGGLAPLRVAGDGAIY